MCRIHSTVEDHAKEDLQQVLRKAPDQTTRDALMQAWENGRMIAEGNLLKTKIKMIIKLFSPPMQLLLICNFHFHSQKLVTKGIVGVQSLLEWVCPIHGKFDYIR